MEIPEELIKAAEEKGIDIIDLLISAIGRSDPSTAIRIRLELAEKYLNEAKEYVRKGDAVQASEKAYKAAEECIKALAERYNIPEHQQAIKEGRWYTYLLGMASNTLASILGDWVATGWAAGYVLHVWGFHEAKFSVGDLSNYLRLVENLVTNTKKALGT
ncbi:PaREP1 family protein [Vulcanisaeta distributa]|uniref:PaREP1 family protein n=1 Tax=Vulcanisaeta distributa (strain DSM 14429 / JCM 11212 / NBRC 100878 / IC-017) TaxID=572478 RepID=E1QTZ2_VULDI|nr:PaREP1 family protein [Vulcanisaeta distributa]ADN49789.1 PaREP1 family protein [Vulcanisaeta distributa DSM 14429]